MTRLALVGALVGLALSSSAAQERPALTQVQQLQFVTAAQAVEIAELRAQAALAEVQRARAALDQVLAGLKVEGYDLRLNDQKQLEYVKKPEPEKK